MIAPLTDKSNKILPIKENKYPLTEKYLKKSVDNFRRRIYYITKISVDGYKKGGTHMYRELLGEMVKKGITRKFIAKKLRISDKTLFNKLNGITEFTWSEIKLIRKLVAPNKKLEDLFKTVDEKEVS